MNIHCLVCALDSFDAVSVSAYREAVRLHLFYAPSDFKQRSKASKAEAARWLDAALRIKREAVAKLEQRT